MNRRAFIRIMCDGGLATFALPRVTFAQVPHRGRLVFILLRGGFDGLAAAVPFGDPRYEALRGSLAFQESDLVPLDDTFGLAPGLAPLKELWDANEIAVLHAMAIPFRTRSHFDGQAILETGLDRPVGSSDGWLNRLRAAGLRRNLFPEYPRQGVPENGVAHPVLSSRHNPFPQRHEAPQDRTKEAVSMESVRHRGKQPLVTA